MKLYCLNYDTDYGDREEWNTFYTPTEIFSSEEKRDARIGELENSIDEDGEPYDYKFYKFEVFLDGVE